MGRFTQLFPRYKPIIGVIHLPPLRGYVKSPGLEGVIAKALHRGESSRLAWEHRADAVIVTGRVTGEPPRLAEIKEAKTGVSDCPVLIGSVRHHIMNRKITLRAFRGQTFARAVAEARATRLGRARGDRALSHVFDDPEGTQPRAMMALCSVSRS